MAEFLLLPGPVQSLGRVPAAKGEVRVCEAIIGRFGARHCSSGSKLDSLRIPPALHPNADSSFSIHSSSIFKE